MDVRTPGRPGAIPKRARGGDPSLHAYFSLKKPVIARELRRLLDSTRARFSRVNAWGPDAARRLRDFSVHGKMIRGGLLLLGFEMFARSRLFKPQRNAGSVTPPDAEIRRGARAALQAAAALEIVHSSLLIHDDIMDNDRFRRGARSVFAQYEILGQRKRARSSERFGRNMGICAGDVGFFLAWDLLSRITAEPSRRAALLSLVSRELACVGLAQMQDVALGSFMETPTRDDVLALYLYKTARYTFSLPLMAGAILAGAGPAILRKLGAFGDLLGVVFQARDDDLGVFGSAARTGKPVGSDIREGKKTLLYLELGSRARGSEKRKLSRLFGKPDLEIRELEFVRNVIERLGARKSVDRAMLALAADAARIIEQLPIASRYREILRRICAQSLTRAQ